MKYINEQKMLYMCSTGLNSPVKYSQLVEEFNETYF
jgi:hypothetical protein